MRHSRFRIARHPVAMAAAVLSAAALVLTGCSTPADTGSDTGATNDEPLSIAYMSFAVANSFDAPMLASAQAVAATNNATVTVFDANNDPQAQFTQLQNVITSGQYDGIILQPIFGTGLIDLVAQAIGQGIKVVNINQVLGPDFTTDQPQVDGLSGNVIIIPTELGKKMGEQVVEACASKKLDPCNVGYLYDIKASALDLAIHDGFNKAIAGSPVKVVAEGESFFTATVALGAVQDMLQANPEIGLIIGSDQGIQGAVQALAAANKTGVLLVGYGASAVGVQGVAAGEWYATVAMSPASEGRLGMEALIKALRTGEDSGAIDPAKDYPNNGVINKSVADKFTAEWPG